MSMSYKGTVLDSERGSLLAALCGQERVFLL